MAVGIEVSNVSGWLTNGDLAVEAGVDFWVSLNVGWFQPGLGVSGRGCVITVSLRFGPLHLRSSLLLAMLEFVWLASEVHLLLLLLGLRNCWFWQGCSLFGAFGVWEVHASCSLVWLPWLPSVCS